MFMYYVQIKNKKINPQSGLPRNIQVLIVKYALISFSVENVELDFKFPRPSIKKKINFLNPKP